MLARFPWLNELLSSTLFPPFTTQGLQRYQETCRWRKEKDADNTLKRPHPKFAIIKECYPVFYHGHDKVGHVVYYELPGLVNFPRLKAAGVDKESFCDHVM